MNYWRGGQFIAKHPGLGVLLCGFLALVMYPYGGGCTAFLVLFGLVMAAAWVYKVMHSQHSLTRAGILWLISLGSRSRTQGSAPPPPSTQQPEQWTMPLQMQQGTYPFQSQQDIPPYQVMQPPPQTSRGSGHIFVPPPLDQDRQ